MIHKPITLKIKLSYIQAKILIEQLQKQVNAIEYVEGDVYNLFPGDRNE